MGGQPSNVKRKVAKEAQTGEARQIITRVELDGDKGKNNFYFRLVKPGMNLNSSARTYLDSRSLSVSMLHIELR